MQLSIRFDNITEPLRQGETRLDLSIVDTSPLRKAYLITFDRLDPDGSQTVQRTNLRSEEFLAEDSLKAKQQTLVTSIGLAICQLIHEQAKPAPVKDEQEAPRIISTEGRSLI